jgi:hypothetical protein
MLRWRRSVVQKSNCLGWVAVTDTLEGKAASIYRFFAKNDRRFGDFQRRKMQVTL